MASTYSSSLKLTLIGDGDQSGIWGQTTNTNLGTLVEQAIAGVQTIVMSNANYTLTDFNGVSNEARNAVLVVTGANSAVRDLIPPVVKKTYIVANNTTGGFGIRVIGATGTGVTIPSGATQVIYCDGVNFYAASGAFVNGAILNVAGGGTGKSSITSGAVLIGNGTGVIQEVSPATVGNYLRSDGSTWYSAPPPGAEFSSGTRIAFNQTTAPTGWTKDTSVDNAALRLVSGSVGSGGTLDFTTAFASKSVTGSVSTSISVSGSVGSTTLSSSQIPSHQHQLGQFGSNNLVDPQVVTNKGIQEESLPFAYYNAYTSAAGGGGSHNHSWSGSGTATSSFTGNAINLAVKYVDLIIAQKN